MTYHNSFLCLKNEYESKLTVKFTFNSILKYKFCDFYEIFLHRIPACTHLHPISKPNILPNLIFKNPFADQNKAKNKNYGKIVLSNVLKIVTDIPRSTQNIVAETRI